MSIRKYMQQGKYNYTWSRDDGDGKYQGLLDRIKVDKDEGYEVEHFISGFIKRYNLQSSEDNIHKIENALHHASLASVVLRNELTQRLALKFKLAQ